ncbi:MAG: lipocalin family protein [Prevotellaceae bacterium]|jgi:hypothetical protein|nr:lipocalin family protein [Prevotellaceae bacterium]
MFKRNVLSVACLMAVAVMFLSSCEKGDNSIVGKWQTTKMEFKYSDGTKDSGPFTNGHFYLNEDKSFILNLEGGEWNDVAGTYTYADKTLVLSIDGYNAEVKVVKLKDKELVLDFGTLLADGEDENFTATIYYQRID